MTENLADDGIALDTESVEALAGREVPQPTVKVAWTAEEARRKKRSPLRIYLGAAPGVGKTYAMLSEGQRRRERGTDVVAGYVQTYGRPMTIQILEGIEQIRPRILSYRGAQYEEMNVEALIARKPEVALVDEFAHTNIPGSRRAKRWEDVLDLLANGIEVITTVNVQHVSSLNDVVADVTGIRQQETVPDWMVALADQVELVDMSPHALRRRMAHGNVYPDPRKAELALRRFFTEENLDALREMALLYIANRVDRDLLSKWTKDQVPETRERILVCLRPGRMAEALVRRGARIAARAGGDLLALHVASDTRQIDPEWMTRISDLVSELGGEFHFHESEDTVETALSFAYRQKVTQIVVGETSRSRWRELIGGGSFVSGLIRKASAVDIHLIAGTRVDA